MFVLVLCPTTFHSKNLFQLPKQRLPPRLQVFLPNCRSAVKEQNFVVKLILLHIEYHAKLKSITMASAKILPTENKNKKYEIYTK